MAASLALEPQLADSREEGGNPTVDTGHWTAGEVPPVSQWDKRDLK